MFAQGVLGSAVVDTATAGAAYINTTSSLLSDPQAVRNCFPTVTMNRYLRAVSTVQASTLLVCC